MEKKKFIVSIGLRGFPYGTAPIQKLKMMGKSVVDGGHGFLVLSSSYVRKSKLNKDLVKEGEIDGIFFKTTSPTVFTPNTLYKKILGRISGKLNELFYILKLKRKRELDAVIVYCNRFFYSALWGAFLRILRIPVFLIYFELRSKVTNRTKWYLRLNDKIYDRFIFYFFNGFFLISDLLINHVKKYAPLKPYLNVPPIVDFKSFDIVKTVTEHPYFLFCGSLAYYEVVEFIIKSYNIMHDNKIKLYLVVNGNQDARNNLIKTISKLDLEKNIQLFSNISNEELYILYRNATALLIPLRNTPQDIARFPHKIAEYCAAGRPIVTTKIGEVVNYFDDDSALMADEYEVNLYAEKLRYVVDNPEACEKMAENSYRIGKANFDYKSFSKPIMEMMFNKL